MSPLADRGPAYRERWAREVHAARLGPDLTLLALTVALLGRSDGTQALASNPGLAEMLDLSVSTVQRRLKQLLDAGWLTRTERGGRSGDGSVRANVYALTRPASTGQGLSTGQSTEEPDPFSVTVSTGQALNRSGELPQQVTAGPSTGQMPVSHDHPPRKDPPRKEDPPSGSRERDPERDSAGSSTIPEKRYSRHFIAEVRSWLDSEGYDHLDVVAALRVLKSSHSIHSPLRWAESRPQHAVNTVLGFVECELMEAQQSGPTRVDIDLDDSPAIREAG